MKILLISGTDDLDKHKYASFQRTHDLYFLQALSEKKKISANILKKITIHYLDRPSTKYVISL